MIILKKMRFFFSQNGIISEKLFRKNLLCLRGVAFG